MKKKYVEELKWLEEDEMLDITAITQSSISATFIILTCLTIGIIDLIVNSKKENKIDGGQNQGC